MTTDLNALVQEYTKLFNDTMRMSMHNVKGGRLRTFCEVMTKTTMEAGVFFRSEGQKTRDVAPQMYDSSQTNAYIAERGGDAYGKRRFEVKPTFSYWAEKLPMIDLHKSMFKPDSSFMRQAFSSLKVKEDLKIVEALEAKLPMFGYKALADNTKLISDPANVKALRQGINLVSSLTTTDTSGVEYPEDYGAVLMNRLDYIELTTTGDATGTNDLLINQNFNHVVGRNGNLTTTLFGMPIIVFKNFRTPADWGNRTAIVEAGDIYIFPNNAIGFVEWEGSEYWEAKYAFMNGDVMMFEAKKSGGAVAIDVEFMVHLGVLPATFA